MNTQTYFKKEIMSINGYDVNSATQAMTLIAYGDCSNGQRVNIPFRNLDFKAQCEDYKDFEECIKIIESYNEFDADTMIPYLREYLDLKKYYNVGNGNNGNSFFKFDIAREGSPAFYVSFSPTWDKQIQIGNELFNYSFDFFKTEMKKLKELLSADEMDIEQTYKVTARFWFD